jgi:drug/metabolite transporter (DMT)-like permease
MNLISFGLIFTGVMLNAAAQILMKAGTNAIGHFEFSVDNIVPIGWKLATEWHILVALGCYALSVVVWILALSRVPVSIAFPMLSMAYVVNAIAAWYLLGEAFSPTKLVGMGIIILGVVIISRA